MGSGGSTNRSKAPLSKQDHQITATNTKESTTIEEMSQVEASKVQSHFMPLPALNDHQRNCQIVFDSLQPLRNEADKRKTTKLLLAKWKERGVLDKVHTYVDAISMSGPTLEEISALLTEKSSPYLLGIERGQHTDLLKAYAIYYWVASNIKYNVTEWNQMVSTCSYPDVSPRHVFKRRSSVCSGYANLYGLLAIQAGLEVTVINGHFRRPITEKGQSDFFCPGNGNSHAWNAVQIGGVWYLTDCTYGAGIISSNSFTKMYNSHYFAIPPEKLILTHWPDSEKWQLLESSLTLQDIRSLIVMTPDAIEKGVGLPACEVFHIKSHQIPVAFLSLKVPQHFLITVTLKPWQHVTSSYNAEDDDRQYDKNIYFNRRDDGKSIDMYIAIPSPGNFTCQIFIQEFSSLKATFLTSYLISCEAEPPDNVGFPQVLQKLSCSINFQLLHWTGHQDDDKIKFYVAECTTGRMALAFEANPDVPVTHFISPGTFTTEQLPSMEQCYHFYSSLTQDEKDPSQYKLDVVFPLQGQWTICLMHRDGEGEEFFQEPLMLYTVNVTGDTCNGTYPWIQSSGVTIHHSGTLSALGNEVFTLTFSVKEAMDFHALLTNSYHTSSFHQFTHIEREETKARETYKLMAVFPEPGKWKISVFHRAINSLESTAYNNLFSLLLDVDFCLPNAIFPSVNRVALDALGLRIVDTLPLRYSNSFFKTQLSATLGDTVSFNISLTPLDQERKETSSVVHGKYYTSLFPSEEEGLYNLEAMLPEPGTWLISLSAKRLQEDSTSNVMQQIFLFKLQVKEATMPTHHMYPKLYPAFYNSSIRIQADHIPYQYTVEDKFIFYFTHTKKPNFNIVVYQENYPENKLSSQALIYPSKKQGKEYVMEAVFPEKDKWILQLFGDSLTDYDPIIEFLISVEIPVPNFTYPWIHADFFEVYKMDFHPSGSYLLPSTVKPPLAKLSFSIFCPDNIYLIHQARDENEAIIDGVTCLLRTKAPNVLCISADFTSNGNWSLLLYASREPSMDNCDLILQHDITVY